MAGERFSFTVNRQDYNIHHSACKTVGRTSFLRLECEYERNTLQLSNKTGIKIIRGCCAQEHC